MLLAGLALLLCAPPQDGGGAEVLARQLELLTAERRSKATRVWQEAGASWLEEASEETRTRLLEWSPEIQEPVMAALWQETELDSPSSAKLLALVNLLGECMNPVGADRLVVSVERLPEPLRLAALEKAMTRGALHAVAATEIYLAQGRPEQRGRAVRLLLRHGDARRAAAWLDAAPLADVNHDELGRGLQALAGRSDLPADFVLPEIYFAQRHPQVLRGMVDLLLARPDRRAEDFLGEIATMTVVEGSTRKAALRAAEAGAAEFRWRRLVRQLESHLEDAPKEELAEDIAWALHRLGSRDGSDFLTDDMRDRVRRNPGDYRSRFRLGSRYVEMDLFKEGYKEFRAGIRSIEGTVQIANVDRLTWVNAARAACGSRHLNEGIEWLNNARMSPRELEKFRDLPEFEVALSKPAFQKAFGIE